MIFFEKKSILKLIQHMDSINQRSGLDVETDIKLGTGTKVLIAVIVIGAIGAGIVAALVMTNQI